MILVFGTVCLDRLHRVPKLPKPGGYVEIEESSTQLGGEAANTAFALQRWNAKYELLGNSVGSGISGDLIRSYLGAAGLKRARIPKEQNPPPICEIMVTPDGQRTMFGIGFANLGHYAKPETVKQFPDADWFTGDPNMNDAGLQAAENARANGARIYWMDYGLPGAHEAPPYETGDWWQSSTDQFGTPGDFAKNAELVKSAAQAGINALLSDGPNGFVLAMPGQAPQHFPAIPVEPRLDSTGAGDCFRAGMLFGLDEGWPLCQTLAFAAAAGGLACRAFGATAATPTRQEVDDLLASEMDYVRRYQELLNGNSISATP